MLNKLDTLKLELNEMGLRYKQVGDFTIEILMPLHVLVIGLALSENLHVRKEDYRGRKIEGKSYKTVKGVINYINRG